MDYGELAKRLLLAPARAMTAMPPEAKGLPEPFKTIHENIDPVGALGGYGNTIGAIFGGPSARTAPLANLTAAKSLDAAGLASGPQWRLTGWHKGYGGDWKFEIPDTNAKLLDFGDVAPLSKALDHPELFTAYPHLAKASVIRMRLPRHQRGGFLADGNIVLNELDDPKLQLSTLLHEIQHAVQAKEGFKGLGANYMEIQRHFDDAINKKIKNAKTDEEFWKYKNIQDAAREKQAPFKVYERDPGETEARNVQHRAGLMAQQLWELDPSMTQQYPYSQQFLASPTRR